MLLKNKLKFVFEYKSDSVSHSRITWSKVSFTSTRAEQKQSFYESLKNDRSINQSINKKPIATLDFRLLDSWMLSVFEFVSCQETVFIGSLWFHLIVLSLGTNTLFLSFLLLFIWLPALCWRLVYPTCCPSSQLHFLAPPLFCWWQNPAAIS